MARYPVRLKFRDSSVRQRFVAASLAMLALVAIGGWWAASNRSASSYTLADLSHSDSRPDFRSLTTLAFQGRDGGSRHVVYPYSVVPGGVRDARELRQESAHDPVVASHYAGFDFRRAKVVVLQEPRLVYLSYRIKDKIFWTKKKVSLRKGDRLITDGNITARTRCANRISEAAQKAVSPGEPPAAVLDQPVPAEAQSVAQLALPESFESALDSRPTPSRLETGIPPGGFGGGGGGGNPPVIVPPPPAGGCSKEPCSQTPPGPPTPVPEPGSILLVSSGLAGIYMRYRKSKLAR